MAKTPKLPVARAVRTKSPYDKTGDATLQVLSWSDEERISRAIKRLAMFLAGTVVATIIPPHWPWLLLMLFVVTPTAAFLTYREKGTIQQGTVPCPDCANVVEVEEQPEDWPIAARCKACRNMFSIDGV